MEPQTQAKKSTDSKPEALQSKPVPNTLGYFLASPGSTLTNFNFQYDERYSFNGYHLRLITDSFQQYPITGIFQINPFTTLPFSGLVFQFIDNFTAKILDTQCLNPNPFSSSGVDEVYLNFNLQSQFYQFAGTNLDLDPSVDSYDASYKVCQLTTTQLFKWKKINTASGPLFDNGAIDQISNSDKFIQVLIQKMVIEDEQPKTQK